MKTLSNAAMLLGGVLLTAQWLFLFAALWIMTP
jgi:hypothetical protein